jgi:sec-independent protein translocase protein TatB
MGTIGPAKILVVLLVALVVLGPEKLPQMARQIGRLWGDFKRFRDNLEAEVRGVLDADGESGETPLSVVRDIRDSVSGTFRTPAPGPPTVDGATTAAAPPAVPAAARPGPSPPGELPIPPDDPSLN